MLADKQIARQIKKKTILKTNISKGSKTRYTNTLLNELISVHSHSRSYLNVRLSKTKKIVNPTRGKHHIKTSLPICRKNSVWRHSHQVFFYCHVLLKLLKLCHLKPGQRQAGWWEEETVNVIVSQEKKAHAHYQIAWTGVFGYYPGSTFFGTHSGQRLAHHTLISLNILNKNINTQSV